MFFRRLTFVLGSLALSLLPSSAQAQIYAAAYLGASHTHQAAVSIEVPSAGLDIVYDDVQFEGRSFESPQYYGLRGGWMFGASRRLGIEVEFIHLKVIANTGEPPMSAVVQRYAMSHGLNFLLVNVVSRTPLGGGPVAFVARAGAGPTLPHAETTILGQHRDRYQYAGMGLHAAGGVDIKLRGYLSLVGEYKFTFARPEITLAAGTGRTTSATHQVVFGLAFGLSR